MQNKDTLFNTIDTHNKHQIVSAFLSPMKQIAHLFLFIFICFSLASFNIITLHAAENDSTSSVNMEMIPNYVESSSTSKVNSITHQENNGARSLEQWPKIDPSDPFSHRVL
ncbi:hypothetical protein [Shewanella surugensis]|uniref:Uncharacterized protein n=1 Tax=Shewanella surugensis TaxID=212020 RepID=A0ABT0LE91_9GAMM|nr:hypothetical protein [Shewanella surugensis]MCL1126018.1 hypothetical protein [Shewanella surugensis]